MSTEQEGAWQICPGAVLYSTTSRSPLETSRGVYVPLGIIFVFFVKSLNLVKTTGKSQQAS